MKTIEKLTVVGREIHFKDIIEELEFDSYPVSEQAEIIQEHLTQVNDFYRKSFSNNMNTRLMINYIESLKRAGMDIGRGECLYGFRMPLSQKEDRDRYLIIFRRREI